MDYRRAIVWCHACLVFACSVAMGHGESRDVLKTLDEKIQRNPDDQELILSRSELHLLRGDSKAALADLKPLNSKNPDDLETIFLLGQAYQLAGDLAQAETQYVDYLERNSAAPRVLVQLSDVYSVQGRHEDAAKMWDRVVATQRPPLPDYFLQRARAYYKVNDTHRAIAGLDEAVEILGPIVHLQKYAVELALNSGDPVQALNRIDVLIDQLPRSEAWLVRKAEIQLEMNAFDQARQNLELARLAISKLPVTVKQTEAFRSLNQRLNELASQLAASSPHS